MIKPVVHWPDKRLRIDSPTRGESWEEVKRCAEDLCDTMKFLGGVGMAAPQIGDPYNIFVISSDIVPAGDLPLFNSCHVFVHPEIVVTSEKKEADLEGCLSFPEIYLKVERPAECTVKARAIDGASFEISAKGLLARAIQHEYEHCRGILMIDYVGELKKDMVKRKIKKWKKRHAPRD